MNKPMKYAAGWMMCVLGVSMVALAQNAQPSRTLVLAGHSGEAPVVEINGHSYVTLESLAQLTGGTLGFKGNRVTLTLPGEAPAAAAPTQGLSKDFLRASIEEVALIREWRSALANAIQNGYPVTDVWNSGYRGRATEGLRLVSLTASTTSDHSVLTMLGNELSTMEALSDRYVAANKSLTYTPTDALASDPLYQKVLDCKDALAQIWSSGQFQETSACN